MINHKFLITLLSSSDSKLLKLSYNSVLNQINHNINYTITCDAHYLDKDHAKYHDLMLAIKDKKAYDDPDRFRYGVQDMYLKNHEDRNYRTRFNVNSAQRLGSDRVFSLGLFRRVIRSRSRSSDF